MGCARCGRPSHTAKDCYAKAHKSGKTVNKVHCVYALNLEGGRKYIGKTDDIQRRLGEHFGGNGAKWTQKYGPTSVHKIQICKNPTNQAKAETIVYKKMSDYHGKDRVRGAGHTSSGCSKCGRESHRAPQCYAKTHENGSRIA